MVKNPPAMQETQVQSLGWENLLEKGMTSHFSILAWRIPCHKDWDTTEQLTLLLSAAKDIIAFVITTDTLSQSGAIEAVH